MLPDPARSLRHLAGSDYVSELQSLFLQARHLPVPEEAGSGIHRRLMPLSGYQFPALLPHRLQGSHPPAPGGIRKPVSRNLLLPAFPGPDVQRCHLYLK